MHDTWWHPTGRKERRRRATSSIYSAAACRRPEEPSRSISSQFTAEPIVEPGKNHLLAKLGEKAPDEVVNMPTRDRAKEAVLRQLNKLKDRYSARSDITFALERAIDRLS
jgi:hypothetical protein